MKVSVIGSGTMGPGIAQTFAQAGNEAILVDIDKSALKRGMDVISSNLSFMLQSGVLSESEFESTRMHLHTSESLETSVNDSDLVVEAVPENLALKKRIFSQVENSCSAQTVISSNSASLSITEIAKSTAIPSRVIGTHYLNPPNLVRIVEVVLGKETSSEVSEKVIGILKNCGKKPVVVKDVPGFVHNRLICALMREATYMASHDIASVEAIDTIVKEAFGPRFPLVGIFGLEDLVGLDVLRDVSNLVFPTLSNADRAENWLESKIHDGHLGAKSGEGFYKWPEGSVSKTREQLTQRFVDVLKSAKES